VVFIHGYYVNGDLWKDVVAQMPGDLMCITPDLPLASHEVPMNADADLSPAGVARIIADLIEELDLEDVVLVGNDSGGALCQIVATEFPERIGGLVLTPCDAFEKFPPAPYNLIRHIARIPRVDKATNALFGAKFARWLTFRPLMKSSYDDQLVRSWVEPARLSPAVTRDGLKFARAVHPRHTIAAASKLPSFDRPALMLWPPDCTFFKFSLAERLAEALPNSRIEPIKDGWTFLPLDQPAAVADAVAAFAFEAEPVLDQPGVTR
jgi:pimeloyl-ACP methyl ester carboxylesterase